jgi:hypothetical protein
MIHMLSPLRKWSVRREALRGSQRAANVGARLWATERPARSPRTGAEG